MINKDEQDGQIIIGGRSRLFFDFLSEYVRALYRAFMNGSDYMKILKADAAFARRLRRMATLRVWACCFLMRRRSREAKKGKIVG